MKALSVRSNILWSIGSRILSLAVSVLSVPLLLRLLGTESYGTWVTLTSLIAFIGLLDLGVGNSLRNSVAASDSLEALHNEFTGFFQLLCGVGLLGLIAFGLAIQFFHFMPSERPAALLLYAPLLLLLPLLLGSSVLQGARINGPQSALQALGSWLFFGWVALLAAKGHSPSLAGLALTWSAFYCLALAATFTLALRLLNLPARRLLRWSASALPKGRLKIGLEFLALQLSSLVLYSLGNTLVFRHLGATEVARYDVLNRLYQVGLSFYTIVIGVMWSEIARYRANSDAAALHAAMRRLTLIAAGFSILAMSGATLVPQVITLWTGHRLQVSQSEAMAVAGLVAIQSVAYVGAVFMNAFEEIRIQVLMGGISIALMIPLATALMDRGLGIVSVPLAAATLTLAPLVVCNLRAVHLVRSVRLRGARP